MQPIVEGGKVTTVELSKMTELCASRCRCSLRPCRCAEEGRAVGILFAALVESIGVCLLVGSGGVIPGFRMEPCPKGKGNSEARRAREAAVTLAERLVRSVFSKAQVWLASQAERALWMIAPAYQREMVKDLSAAFGCGKVITATKDFERLCEQRKGAWAFRQI